MPLSTTIHNADTLNSRVNRIRAFPIACYPLISNLMNPTPKA